MIVYVFSKGSREHRYRDLPDEFQGEWGKAETASSGKHMPGRGKTIRYVTLLQHQGGLIQPPMSL
ncbi:hypothetical protein KDA_48500 [Dictyobacter alpinus]|uniref:Uncharacterized protein n=1 Tax=Dictyobacter alpinus TaxID=2014873 RepID=A0A402BDH5_9CHLR|nr:hypothetical protein KDA_48500 [Dictyobacter alpinus]